MSDNKNNAFEVILTGVRFSHLYVREARAYKTEDKKRFTGNFLLDPKDPASKRQLKSLQTKIKALSMEVFGAEIPAHKTCLRKDDAPKDDAYRGMYYVAAARPEKQGPPQIVGPNLEPIGAMEDMAKSGDYGDVKLRIYAQENYGNINASIEVVQHTRKGERFGGSDATVEGMTAYDASKDTDGLDDGEDDSDLD